MEKVKTSVSLDEDIYQFIAKLAEKKRTNISQVINSHFLKLMQDEDKKNLE